MAQVQGLRIDPRESANPSQDIIGMSENASFALMASTFGAIVRSGARGAAPARPPLLCAPPQRLPVRARAAGSS